MTEQGGEGHHRDGYHDSNNSIQESRQLLADHDPQQANANGDLDQARGQDILRLCHRAPLSYRRDAVRTDIVSMSAESFGYRGHIETHADARDGLPTINIS